MTRITEAFMRFLSEEGASIDRGWGPDRDAARMLIALTVLSALLGAAFGLMWLWPNVAGYVR